MPILETVNYYWPDTIAKLALDQKALPEGVPFMGAFVELREGKSLPTGAEVTAKIAEYEAAIVAENLRAAMQAHRTARADGGFTFNNIPIATNERTRGYLDSMRAKAVENPSLTIDWDADGIGYIKLNAQTIIAIADAAFSFVQKCYSVGWIISDAIIAGEYTSIAQMLAAFDAAMES